jgi:hypothetical protein
MSEIYNDIKVNLVEAVGNLGINLTSTDTRINHTKSGTLDMLSNGTINISSGYSEIYNPDYVVPGNINIITKDATETTEDPISINIRGGKGTANIEGSSINIISGSGGDNLNSYGGELSIRSGQGRGTGDGGQIEIVAGLGRFGDGGDMYIGAGDSNRNDQNGANGGSISIHSGKGADKCGDINAYLGVSDANNGASIPYYAPPGRFKINYGAFNLSIFDDPTKRDDRIPIPEKGDMCFVEDKINVYDGSRWRTLSYDPLPPP